MDPKTDQANDLEARLQDDALVGRALQKAARQAIREHKEEGLASFRVARLAETIRIVSPRSV